MTTDDTAEILKLQPHSLQAQVLDRLRDEIIRGVWRPGVRLQERALCERFGISRSPLREAYQVLAAEGLLELLRNRGAVVSAPSLPLVLQNYTLLRTLEVLAIELACDAATDADLQAIAATHDEEKRATDPAKAFELNNALHRMIVVASHNQPVIDAHHVVSRQIIRVQNVNGFPEPRVMPGDEHDTFIGPLLKRSKAGAVKGLKAHLTHVEDNLRQRLMTLAETEERRVSA